ERRGCRRDAQMLAFTVLGGGPGKPARFWTEQGGPELEPERMDRHWRAYQFNADWLTDQLVGLFPRCLGRYVAVGNRESFIAATHQEAVDWIEANHSDDIGAFVAHVWGTDIDARGRPFWQTPDEDANRCRTLAHGRNHCWLARKRLFEEVLDRFVAV